MHSSTNYAKKTILTNILCFTILLVEINIKPT